GSQPKDTQRWVRVWPRGRVAARRRVRDFAMTDDEIVAGIDSHTTAMPAMTRVQQCLFVADKIDPHKVERNPALEQVRDLAQTDLDSAVLRSLDITLEEALREHELVHPLSIDARNALLQKLLPVRAS